AGAVGPVDAIRPVSFSARVDVQWVDGRGRHATTVDVGAARGRVRVAGTGSPERPGAGAPPTLGDGWLLVTPAGPGAPVGDLPPAVEAKYDIERTVGPVVAGRTTTLVVLSEGAMVREKLAIDDELGLVLRRELFGPDGRPVRTVTVIELDPSSPRLAGTPTTDDRAEPVAPDVLGALYRTPGELAGGYRRVGAFRRGPVVHVLYSDGLHGLSLFMQPGRLDRHRQPPGGAAVRIGSATGQRYTWAGGEIVTWESGPVVRTLVGDAATAEVVSAARSVPPTGRPSLSERLRSACRQMAEVLGAG
ncbi:MAG: hypothetical protein ACRDY5_02625, partial [Acidimicrobiales bacterium]